MSTKIYYIQPPQAKPYGKGDGSSLANSWNGWSSIDWDKVSTGDILQVSGTHNNTGARFAALSVKKPGVTIRGSKAVFDRYYFDFEGISNITWDSLKFTNSGQFQAPGAKSIVIKNCWFNGLDPSNDHFIRLYPGNDDWVLDNTLVENSGTGLYSIIDLVGHAPSAQRITVKNCHFRNIGTKEHPHQDGHAIGIQEGCGHKISNVWTENTGEAISFWARSTEKMTDITVDSCKVETVHKEKNTDGHGIVISGSHDSTLPKAGWRSNIKITNNNVANTDGNAIRSNIRDKIVITGNHVQKYGLAGEYKDPIFLLNPFGPTDNSGVKNNTVS